MNFLTFVDTDGALTMFFEALITYSAAIRPYK